MKTTGDTGRVTTGEERFAELAAEAMDDLPEWVRETMENLDVFVEDYPPPNEPSLLGLYQGVPLSRRGVNYAGTLPDRITLFRAPIERLARGDDNRLRSIIVHTIAHEVAHHFGISDERLREIDAY
jgi:predicted Zn-dependent protease with MMP-like domain